jgi:hypothetical protein
MATTIGPAGLTFNDGTTNSSAAATGVPVINAYTSPGSYTKPGTVKAIKVTVAGGGGGGTPGGQYTQGGGQSSTTYYYSGSAGGAGGTAISVFAASSLPASAIPFTVGGGGSYNPGNGTSSAGGNSVFNGPSTLTGNGGSGNSAPAQGPGVAAGGSATGGTLNLSGSGGSAGLLPGNSSQTAVGGISAVVGYGGGAGVNTTSGQSGIVIIEEFY